MSLSIAKAIRWSLLENLFMQATTFLIGIVIARFVGAREYGVCGVLMVFIVISRGLVDSGFSSALIYFRDPEHEETDRSTVFYTNFAIGLFCYGLLCTGAGWIAAFYGDPRLQAMTYVLGLCILLNGLSIVPRNILWKSLHVKELSICHMLGVVIGGGVGVITAIHGAGAWSLIYYRLSTVILECLALTWVCRWCPRWIFSWSRLKALWGYGVRILLMSFVENVCNNIESLLIGKFFSLSSLGYYQRGQSIQALPGVLVQGVISRVCFPVFSTIRHDHKALKDNYLNSVWAACSIMLLFSGALLLSAKYIIVALLTDRWIDSVIFVKILACCGWLMPIQTIGNALLNGMGEVKRLLRLTLIQRLGLILIIVCCLPFGLIPLVCGLSTAVVTNSLLSMCAVAISGVTKVRVGARTLLTPFAIAIFATLSVLFLENWLPESVWLRLFALPIMFLLIYGGGILLFERPKVSHAMALIRRAS